MPTFLITSHLTEQGSRNVKEVPKRVAASREAAKKFGVEIKQIYMTAGEAEFLVIVESASGGGGSLRSRRWPSALRDSDRVYVRFGSLATERVKAAGR
jgi:hypothetical protein